MTTSLSALALPLSAHPAIHLGEPAPGLSGDGGWLLLALADQHLGLTARLAAVVPDRRIPTRIQHPWRALLQQRVYQIAQGYADANDAQTLRHDPALKLAVGRPPSAPPLAGQATLSRWENAVTEADLKELAVALQEQFLTQLPAAPTWIVVDLDPYHDPAHGEQEGVRYHGYYRAHGYLPCLLAAAADGGPQQVVGAVLREGTARATEAVIEYLEAWIPQLQRAHPQARIVLRADGAYGVAAMLACCRGLRVDYLFGLAENAVLRRLAAGAQARAQQAETWRQSPRGDARRPLRRRSVRCFASFDYQAESWPEAERVVVKWEITAGEDNPRYYVTSLSATRGWTPKRCHQFYAQRGTFENRIKEFKLDLDGGRLSCQRFLANQFRLVLHAAAYVLYQGLQAWIGEEESAGGLRGAQAGTLRQQLLKVAVVVEELGGVIRVRLAQGFAQSGLWRELAQRCGAKYT